MKILIIEDNISLVSTLKDVLESNSNEVDYILSLDNIDDYALLNSYDLILLYLMLGAYNGFDFLKTIRDDINTPIIILTAKNTKEDIMMGFGLGADDYITKPFDMDILLARIKARIGRLNQGIYYKKTKFDFDRFLITKECENVQMTSTEARILKFLYNNKGIFSLKKKYYLIHFHLLILAKEFLFHISTI